MNISLYFLYWSRLRRRPCIKNVVHLSYRCWFLYVISFIIVSLKLQSKLLTSKSRTDLFFSSFQRETSIPEKKYNVSPFNFSACLLIKDANPILPEWLAYHYTFLPLRRLIVALDPNSLTDPRPILDLYRDNLGMNISLWTNESHPFLNDYFDKKNKNRFYRLKVHRYRQRKFYQNCFTQLQHENQSWTITIDTDEFIAFNYYGAREEQHHNNIRSHFEGSSTAAQHISRGIDPRFNPSARPCIILGRYLFLSNKTFDLCHEKYNRKLPESFHEPRFFTLRFQYRQALEYVNLGKPMFDVSRYNGEEVTHIHKLFQSDDICHSNKGYVTDRQEMSFRVHHYVGTWETFRRTGFDSRGYSSFQERNGQKNFPDPPEKDITMRSWLSQFIQQVGNDTAYITTESLIRSESIKYKQLFEDIAEKKVHA